MLNKCFSGRTCTCKLVKSKWFGLMCEGTCTLTKRRDPLGVDADYMSEFGSEF